MSGNGSIPIVHVGRLFENGGYGDRKRYVLESDYETMRRERDKARRELEAHSAVMGPMMTRHTLTQFPREQNRQPLDWTIDPAFLQLVKTQVDAVPEHYEISMEEIEEVLLALEKVKP